jgi:light-regulated signal transduction histidine kinase (bacteriophytochrome)
VAFTEASELSPLSGSTAITSTVHRLSSNDQHEDSRVPEKLLRCEDEPIHLPEAVQAFGVLIALRDTGKGQYPVRIASENSQDIIGHDPETLFRLSCFTNLLNFQEKNHFLARIGTAKLWHHKDNPRAYPDVFTMIIGRSSSSALHVYCALHYREDTGLFVCEFEPKNDLSVDVPPDNSSLPEESVNIIDNQASAAERSKSITKYSEPLRTAQRMKHEIGELEVFHLLCEIQEQINAANSIPFLLDILVGLVFDLTGFHRVMVYQFDDEDAGVVRSEFIDERASIDLYHGLHFPASDIPPQARRLYKLNKIRLLYDRAQPTARLVYRTKEDALTPLDLSMSYLRAMSPVHKKYLKNMGVRASFSISLIVHDRLWGLISCHDYGLEGRRVSFPVRELCRSLGDCASNNIEKLLYLSRIEARKPLTKAPPKVSPSSYVAASSSDLLEMFKADFGFLAIRDEARTIGRLFAYNECLALLQYVRSKSHKVVFNTQSIATDCPDILFPARFTSISGMLVIPLALSGSDFLVFFRRGQLKEVAWAGNPHEKKFKPGTSYLEPRASFRRWSERVVGTCREWTQEQG